MRPSCRPPIEEAVNLNGSGVTITVSGKTDISANVQITSNFARRCKQGYVWREAW